MAASFSFLQIGCLVYDQPLTRLYRAEPALARTGLAEQTVRLESEGLMPVLGMARAMAWRGYRVIGHHFSLISLQAAWTREHLGGNRLCHTMAERVVVAIAQVRRARPDVVYIQGLNALPPTFMAALRDACPSIRGAVGHVGSAFTAEHLRGYDVVLGCVPGIAAAVTAAGMPGGTMYHAIDTDSFRDCDAERPRSHPFPFTGSYGLVKTHGARYHALRTLIRDAGLTCWLHDFGSQENGLGSQGFPLSVLFPDRIHGALIGPPMIRLLADSWITFNFHSAEAAGDAGNTRLFEATLAATCQACSRPTTGWRPTAASTSAGKRSDTSAGLSGGASGHRHRRAPVGIGLPYLPTAGRGTGALDPAVSVIPRHCRSASDRCSGKADSALLDGTGGRCAA